MKRLTVSSLYRQSGEGAQARGTRVPAVRLTGAWLARLGFTAGTKLNVRTVGPVLIMEIAR
ncbi:MAG: SymE family type I addiction module toxin [Chthoniobacteraceae bacterium]